MPKGFGKNYFTLAAIQACSNRVTLERTSMRAHALHLRLLTCEDEEEADEEQELLPAVSESTLESSPSHCNCHYKRRTRCIISRFNLAFSSQDEIESINPSNSPPPFSKHLFNQIQITGRIF